MRRRVTVLAWQRGVHLHRGHLVGVLGPGRHWVQWGSKVLRLDVRRRVLTMPTQEMLTADGVVVRVSLAAHWRVADPLIFVSAADDAKAALYLLLQLGLRAPVADVPVHELVADRGRILDRVAEQVRPAAAELGIALDTVAVRDLSFPAELRSAFAEVVRAREEARAALERTRGEQATLRSLANTAALLERHPTLLRLRAVQAAERTGGTLVLHTGE